MIGSTCQSHQSTQMATTQRTNWIERQYTLQVPRQEANCLLLSLCAFLTNCWTFLNADYLNTCLISVLLFCVRSFNKMFYSTYVACFSVASYLAIPARHQINIPISPSQHPQIIPQVLPIHAVCYHFLFLHSAFFFHLGGRATMQHSNRVMWIQLTIT